MILGLGVDLVEVARFERAVARQGEHFLHGFLRPQEIERFGRAPHPPACYASAFAVKEALFKALGTGRSESIRWHDVAVPGSLGGSSVSWRQGQEEEEGSTLLLAGETARMVERMGVRRIYLSRTQNRSRSGLAHVLALVVLEGWEEAV